MSAVATQLHRQNIFLISWLFSLKRLMQWMASDRIRRFEVWIEWQKFKKTFSKVQMMMNSFIICFLSHSLPLSQVTKSFIFNFLPAEEISKKYVSKCSQQRSSDNMGTSNVERWMYFFYYKKALVRRTVFLNGLFPVSFFFIFVFSIQLTVNKCSI